MPDHSKGLTLRPQPGEKRRLLPYVSAELHRRLREYCAANGQSQSAVVEAALSGHFDDGRDMALVMRRLDRLGRAQDRAQRDNAIFALAFATYLQLWLAHTPAVPAEAKDAARRSAASRYKQFLEQTARLFTNGHRFLDDLPKEVFADDAELEAVARAAYDTAMSAHSPPDENS